jgi:hypothetical protein
MWESSYYKKTEEGGEECEKKDGEMGLQNIGSKLRLNTCHCFAGTVFYRGVVGQEVFFFKMLVRKKLPFYWKTLVRYTGKEGMRK